MEKGQLACRCTYQSLAEDISVHIYFYDMEVSPGSTAMCLCGSYHKDVEGHDDACEICLRMGSQHLTSHTFADVDPRILTECVSPILALI